MNQNYTNTQLKKLCKFGELDSHELNEPRLETLTEQQLSKIIDGSFSFDITKLNNHYKINPFPQLLLVRKLNDNLKRIYKDTQANRDIITHQVKVLLEETCPIWILKTDISSFYESIDRDVLIKKLESDNLLSYYSIFLLKKIFNHPSILNSKGLPRGISISSTLSEIYMRKFDKWCIRHDGIYYYARFVDDIILFSYKKETLEKLKDNIYSNLGTGLKINQDKTKLFDGSNIRPNSPLNFLGYEYSTKTIKRNKKEVSISISEKKIKRLKSRLVYSFLSFIQNGDFDLLVNRIKFLSGNYSVRKSKIGNNLKAGLYYNYKFVNNLSVFEELDVFFRKIINSRRKSFGRKLNYKLSTNQKRALNQFSFKFGFENRVHKSFTPTDLITITSCWK